MLSLQTSLKMGSVRSDFDCATTVGSDDDRVSRARRSVRSPSCTSDKHHIKEADHSQNRDHHVSEGTGAHLSDDELPGNDPLLLDDDEDAYAFLDDHEHADSLLEGDGDVNDNDDATRSGYYTRAILQHMSEDLAQETERRARYPPSLWPPGISRSGKNEEKIYDTRTHVLADQKQKELELHHFCFYSDTKAKRFPGQYESLYTIALRRDKTSFLVDGIITNGAQQMRLVGAEIVELQIGGTGTQHHSCKDTIRIQTKTSCNFNTWLKLKNPASAYQPLWDNFFWIANFAKYVSDYISFNEGNNRLIAFGDFKSEFTHSLTKLHENNLEFENWRKSTRNISDLRRHLSQFRSFVKFCCRDVETIKYLEKHPVWREIGFGTSSMPVDNGKTLVTPNVGSTFLTSFSNWGTKVHNLLHKAEFCAEVQQSRRQRIEALHMPNKFEVSQHEHFRIENGLKESKVEWTLRKARQMNTTIKRSPEHLLRKLVVVRQHVGDKVFFDYAIVTQIAKNQRNARIIWMTLPTQTFCTKLKVDSHDQKHKQQRRSSGAFYPIGNELFFSSDCNCEAINISDVVGVYSIMLLSDYKGQPCEFFAVLQYCEDEQCFVQMTESQSKLHNLLMCKELCTKQKHSTGTTYRRRHSIDHQPHHPSGEQVHSSEILSNVSLFSGCGLFDRALETSGCLRTTVSIDYNANAIRSAKANSHESIETDRQFITSSVNTELGKLLRGEKPFIKCDSISAGVPCPGFSLANNKRLREKGQRDCSLLASALSWIELLLPVYVVIENVIHMDSGSPNACSQAMYFLVALGYQVRKCVLKANKYGGCTTRERLFILAAAPAFMLPRVPTPTHGDGLEPQLTIRQAISDLTEVRNDEMVRFAEPYHVPLQRLSAFLYSVVRQIPSNPPGQGLISSLSLLKPSHQKWVRTLHYKKRDPPSRALTRVHPDKFFPTIVTGLHLVCKDTGVMLHYDQDRVLSLEEVARAQGVPGWFILIGSMTEKLKQIGNAVPWCLGEAIGREIAKAYRQSCDGDSDETAHSDGEDDGEVGEEGEEEDAIAFGSKEEHDRARSRTQPSRQVNEDEDAPRLSRKRPWSAIESTGDDDSG